MAWLPLADQAAALAGAIDGAPASGSVWVETTGAVRFALSALDGEHGTIFGALVIWPRQVIGSLDPPEYRSGSGFMNTQGSWRVVRFGACIAHEARP